MSRDLRQNTATRVTVGPFQDKTTGVDPEVALTVTNCKLTFMVDTAGVPTLVIDAAATASGGNNDMVHVTGDDAGFYDLELTAAQTNYVGRAILSITDAANHCPVFHEFSILPATVYDAKYGVSNLPVDVVAISGDTTAADNAELMFDGTGYAGGTAKLNVNVASIDNIDFGATMKASINTEVDNALNTAIPGTPTADSINERIATIDGHITADYGATEKSAIDLLDDAAGGLADIHTDVGTVAGYLDTEIAAIKAKTDLISTASITVTSPVATDGTVTIIRGDDYNNSDSRAIDWANTAGSWPDLTNATIAFIIAKNWTIAGSVVTPTGTGQKVRAQPTAAETTKLKRGEYEYDVRATLATSSRIVTLASGRIVVDE